MSSKAAPANTSPRRSYPARPSERAAPEFTLGGVSVPLGTTTQVELPVARLPTGVMLSLDVLVIRGAQPGRTVWLSSTIHGDELNGIAIIRRVMSELSPENLRGTILAVPVVNMFGLINESRYLPDRRDLNRSFPGSKRGSLSAQLAHLFIEEVVQRCDFGVDLHTGSQGRRNLPHIRCDLDQAEARSAARAFGAPVTLHSETRDGSLRACARALGVPVLLYEAGEARRFDSEGIEIGTQGVLRTLAHLKMYKPNEAFESFPKPIKSRSSHWERASRSGFFEVSCGLGQMIAEGDTLGTIYNALGVEQRVVRATQPGLLIALQSHALVHKGEAVAHIAHIDSQRASKTHEQG